MTVEVTQEDIICGKRFIPCGCPVALALQRLGFTDICVGLKHLITAEEIFETPQPVYDFIVAFDRRKPVQPFTFTLGD